MRSAIDILCGLTSETPVAESTMTTNVGTGVIDPLGAKPVTPLIKSKRSKIADLLAKRKLRQESGDEVIIPKDAKPEQVAMQPATGDASRKINTNEPLIPTSVALVAPDTTPNSDTPLDPSQVQQVQQSGAAEQAATPSASNNPLSTSGDATAGDVMRTLIGAHQESYRPAAIVNPADAVVAMNAALAGGDAAGVVGSITAKAKASQVLSEAQAGVEQKPYHNPNAMNKAIATTRAILGM